VRGVSDFGGPGGVDPERLRYLFELRRGSGGRGAVCVCVCLGGGVGGEIAWLQMMHCVPVPGGGQLLGSQPLSSRQPAPRRASLFSLCDRRCGRCDRRFSHCVHPCGRCDRSSFAAVPVVVMAAVAQRRAHRPQGRLRSGNNDGQALLARQGGGTAIRDGGFSCGSAAGSNSSGPPRA